MKENKTNLFHAVKAKSISSFFVQAKSLSWDLSKEEWVGKRDVEKQGRAVLQELLGENPKYKGKPVKVLQIQPLDSSMILNLVELEYIEEDSELTQRSKE